MVNGAEQIALEYFETGEILKAVEIVKELPESEIRDCILNRFYELKQWNKLGRPSFFWNPPNFNYFPKFPLLLKKLKERTEIKRVLDIGCHTGYLLTELVNYGYNGAGIDISRDMMNMLNEGARRFNLPLTFYFLNAEKIKTKFKKKEFNAIFLLDVLEHCFDDNKVIKAAEKILKKNGWVFINLPIKTENYKDEALEHLRMYSENDILNKFGFKKNFELEKCQDELGRLTNFISYQI